MEWTGPIWSAEHIKIITLDSTGRETARMVVGSAADGRGSSGTSVDRSHLELLVAATLDRPAPYAWE